MDALGRCSAVNCSARSTQGWQCHRMNGHEGPHEVVVGSRLYWIDGPPATAAGESIDPGDLPRYDGRSLKQIFADAHTVCSKVKTSGGAGAVLELLERELRAELVARQVWAISQAGRASRGQPCSESYAMLAGALNAELATFTSTGERQ